MEEPRVIVFENLADRIGQLLHENQSAEALAIIDTLPPAEAWLAVGWVEAEWGRVRGDSYLRTLIMARLVRR